jgi:hypothetical protein
VFLFSAFGCRLDDSDYKAICNNVKYLALKEETVNGNMKDPMVILTKKWGFLPKREVGENS